MTHLRIAAAVATSLLTLAGCAKEEKGGRGPARR